ncbi:MAG: hypothetical protein AAFU54_10240 [Chloroflexota bacterium]
MFQLRTVYRGKRLIAFFDEQISVWNVTNQELLIGSTCRWACTSMDESILLIKDVDYNVSVWNLLDGRQIVYKASIIDAFADYQQYWSDLQKPTSFMDIVTGKHGFSTTVPTPEGEEYGYFEPQSHYLPDSPYSFHLVEYDSDWGETRYVWCFDRSNREWFCTVHVGRYGSVEISGSVDSSFAVVVGANGRQHCIDLKRRAEVDILEPRYQPHAVVLHPLHRQIAYIAFGEAVYTVHLAQLADKLLPDEKQIQLRNEKFKHLFHQTGIVALTTDSPGDSMYLMLREPDRLSIQVRNLRELNVINEVMFNKTMP